MSTHSPTNWKQWLALFLMGAQMYWPITLVIALLGVASSGYLLGYDIILRALGFGVVAAIVCFLVWKGSTWYEHIKWRRGL